jgi:RND family efflux transporter MFP subunit
MKINNLLLALICIIFLGACESDSEADKLKAKIEKIKNEIQEKSIEAHELEQELMAIDPEFSKQQDKSVLVETKLVKKQHFEHKIQVQGEVSSRKNINMSAETMGRVTQITVEPGDLVQKGQILIRLDAAIMQNSVKELQTSLELATTIFEKQKNLWDQEIGTEVQYLEAKNRKESLERQLATLQSQLNMSTIRAPFAGRINSVDIRTGEIAQPGMPIVSVVSNKEMYLKADVSEDYISDFSQGDSVEVYLPSLQKSFSTNISAISYVINPANRTFQIDVKLTDTRDKVKPNQFVRMDLVDYENDDAIMVDSDVIQQDNLGDFVFTVGEKDGSKVAKKVQVKRGKTYKGKTEILNGLTAGEQVISVGQREVVDGITIKLSK